MANDFVTVTRTLVKRGWSDIEPKIAIALVSGTAATFLLELAAAYNVTLPDRVVTAIPLACAILGGYLTPSVGTTIVHPNEADGTIVEQHSGQTVSTFTAPTTVQHSPPQSFTDIVQPSTPPAAPVTAWGLPPRNTGATEILPSDMSAD